MCLFNRLAFEFFVDAGGRIEVRNGTSIEGVSVLQRTLLHTLKICTEPKVEKTTAQVVVT